MMELKIGIVNWFEGLKVNRFAGSEPETCEPVNNFTPTLHPDKQKDHHNDSLLSVRAYGLSAP